MNRTAVYCGCSALLAAGVTLWATRAPSYLPVSNAQEIAQAPPPASQYPPAAAPPNFSPPGGASPYSPPTAPSDDLTPEERVSVAVYENVNRCVVHITTETVQSEGFFMEFTAKGEGSGSVISREGHILTNFHVVEDARAIQVNLWNGKPFEAKLIGQDPSVDIAVLKIDAPPEILEPVTFGDSTRLRVGQRVYAIGNPFGLERTLSTGIISSLNRSLPSRRSHRTIKQVIQIDASINPGNSGGPLLDSHGRMIGINTAIASKTGESAGVGFAIPISTAARVVPQLIANGKVIRPDVGIARVWQTEKGLRIATLMPGGPAERAGLRGPRVVTQKKRQGPFIYPYQTVDRSAADLIVAVDGQPVRTADEFLTAIESKQPGQQVVLGIVREGQKLNVPVDLAMADE